MPAYETWRSVRSLRMSTRRLLRLVAAAAVIVLSGLWSPRTASAHTDFEFSLPVDGATIGVPLTEVTVGFTEPVTLVGPGFEVLDPQGNISHPFVVTDDDQVFRLQIDPPLGGGVVGVRYEVAAADGHVIAGEFSFTVSVDAPPPTTDPPTTSPAPSIASTSTSSPPTVASTATSPPSAEASPDPPEVTIGAPLGAAPESDDGSGSNTGLYIAIAVVIAVGAAGFLLFRQTAR